MRINEIFSDEEWQRLEQLIYASAYKALIAYQQQRAIAHKPAATLKPQAAKKAKSLARKAQRPPHTTAPKSLPKPAQQVTHQPSKPQNYSPIKVAKPLPATTRSAIQQATVPKGETVKNFGDLDQATRRWLPKDKQGMNTIDLLSLDERG